ncbi:hypothetical protein BA065_03360 [Nanoarchaeota archaeon NZ13-N]|nr:MAG: hypothetical protein BA065_03360 [Nanoarchaeota archaeon NZ13-N]
MSATEKKRIVIELDSETYWKLRDYLVKLKVRGWKELFNKYFMPYLEKLVEQNTTNVSANIKAINDTTKQNM